jgi:hypothetical protein
LLEEVSSKAKLPPADQKSISGGKVFAKTISDIIKNSC